jgi:hypothetical protein
VPRRKIQPGLLSPADAADLNARLEWLEQRAVVAATGGILLTEGPGGTVVRQPPATAAPPVVTPVVLCSNNADQSLVSGAETPLTVGGAIFGQGGFSVSGGTKLTFPEDGYYLIGASVEFSGNNTGIRRLALRVAGTGNPPMAIVQQDASAAGAPWYGLTLLSVSGIQFRAAGSYVEAFAYQNSGATLSVLSDPTACSFNLWAARLA